MRHDVCVPRRCNSHRSWLWHSILTFGRMGLSLEIWIKTRNRSTIFVNAGAWDHSVAVSRGRVLVLSWLPSDIMITCIYCESQTWRRRGVAPLYLENNFSKPPLPLHIHKKSNMLQFSPYFLKQLCSSPFFLQSLQVSYSFFFLIRLIYILTTGIEKDLALLP